MTIDTFLDGYLEVAAELFTELDRPELSLQLAVGGPHTIKGALTSFNWWQTGIVSSDRITHDEFKDALRTIVDRHTARLQPRWN